MRGKSYKLSEKVLQKYHGCGNGWVRIKLDGDVVVAMAYLDQFDNVIEYQNIDMIKNAGEEIRRTSRFVTFRCNFSCGHADLF